MRLAPILTAGVALLVAACGSDVGGASKGDDYTASVKQADDARKAGDFDSAIPLYGRALQARLRARVIISMDREGEGRVAAPPCHSHAAPCSLRARLRVRAMIRKGRKGEGRVAARPCRSHAPRPAPCGRGWACGLLLVWIEGER